MISKVQSMAKLRGIIPYILFGMFFGVMLSLGKQMGKVNGTINWMVLSTYIYLFLYMVLFAIAIPIIRVLLGRILKKEVVIKCIINSVVEKVFDFFIERPYLIFIVIIVSWIPILLASYPGIYSYDSSWQYRMVFGEDQFTTHHPVIHTIWLAYSIRIGEYLFSSANIGMLIYSITQMVLNALGITYVLWRFKEYGKIAKFVFIISLLFVCFFPLNGLMAICSTKDSFFAVLFMIVFIELSEIMRSTKTYFGTRRPCLFIVVSFFAMTFRNNMRYAFVLAGVIIIFSYVLKHNIDMTRKILPLFIVPFLMLILYELTIYPMMGVTSGSDVEMYSVPLQQLAAVYRYSQTEGNGGLTKQELNQMIQCASAETWEAYDPEISDPVKVAFSFSIGKKAFFILWIKLILKFPARCLNAFLQLTMNYWYVFTNNCSHTLKLVNYRCIEPVKFVPILSNYHEWLSDLCNEFSFRKIIGIRILFNNGFYLWLIILAMTEAFVKRKNVCGYFALPISYFITILFGPVALTRYMYPLILSTPIPFLILFCDKK